MKHLISTILGLTMSMGVSAQTDTLYYDKEWKGIENKAFASYFKVIPSSEDSKLRQPFRNYYITGELQAEGYYLSIDKNDDSKSILDGTITNYFKNGKIEQKSFHSNGKQQGECFRYRENGLVSVKANYKDGKLDGLYTEFSEEDNICTQIEYKDGEPRFDWMMVSNADGLCSKVNLYNRAPIYESPYLTEKKTEYRNGEEWSYYNKNGIVLSITRNQVTDYGKWYQIYITITNNSLFPIEFNPSNITAVLFDKNEKRRNLKVYLVEDYLKKVKRRQNWSIALKNFAESMAVYDAGYSTSTTTTSSNGHTSTYGTASAYGSGGYAHGSFSGKSYYNSNTTSTTRTYDGTAAYIAQVIASDRMAQYKEALLSERQAKKEEYIKWTTIKPGETTSGYVNIERKWGKILYIYIQIQDAIYEFPWWITN